MKNYTFFYKKPSQRPSTKSFLIFGRILVLKVSKKFLNLANQIAAKAYSTMHIANYLSYNKHNASVRDRF